MGELLLVMASVEAILMLSRGFIIAANANTTSVSNALHSELTRNSQVGAKPYMSTPVL